MKALLTILCLVLAGATAAAQDRYPSRPITFVVGFAAGGAGEMVARLVSDYARDKRGVTIGVEFKPGAGATIATGQVARARPDGYTVSLFSVSPLLVAPHLQSVPYDTLKDFTYLAAYIGISIPIYVTSASPYQSYADLLSYAKANPGKLRWGTAAVRGVAHIATEAAFRKEGVKATFVPFSGGAEAITALLGNHIEAVVSSDYGPHLDAGSVRLLVETGPAKIPGHEALPTFAELGYPISVPAAYGVFGPKGLSPEVIAWWETLLKEMTQSPQYADVVKKLRGTPLYQDSAGLTQTVATGFAGLGKEIEGLGLRQK
ncbi:MAG: tripartite tricarboxylate transporter substrate binding protein [Alphaproteobacteria bacterium]|nr:tripartite tricarboxylate transporter substrate binding protein [Alphaproteobacteria bacterium]